MMSQIESGHGCPITMTFAAVPALRNSPEVAAEWVPRLTNTQYDGRNVPAHLKTACTAGMAMTEKQGGSDVRANSTRARIQADGTYLLVGHKWFCSAPMSDVFLTLAHCEAGLSCFLVPRWLPDGTPNAMNLQRLKDKLGNHSNASAEIEYENAYGVLVGEPGRGVRTIIDMVAHTRLDCVVASAGLMRQAVAQSVHHATHRKTFGARLIDHALMKNVLADLTLEAEAATALAFRLAAAYEAGEADPAQAAFARIATAVGKYWVCKRAPTVAYEAMECHGGNGYVETHCMARLYREAPLNSIWEGSGNVICLDVLRALAKEPIAAQALRNELKSTAGAHSGYDDMLRSIEACLAQPKTMENNARRLVEMIALTLQASVLMRHGDSMIANAFMDSRFSGERFACFGALAAGTDFQGIVDRSNPVGH
jgi:putative acyl-CoA dehydrogenase